MILVNVSNDVTFKFVMFLFLSEKTLLKNCHQVTLEIYINIVRHLQNNSNKKSNGSFVGHTDEKKEEVKNQDSLPPLSSACHVHGGAPCPSAGRERYVLLRGVEAGLVLQEWEEVEGSESAERRLEVLERGATVALDVRAPMCHCRHGYDTEKEKRQ